MRYDVPVANTFVAFMFWEFVTLELFVVAFIVVKNPVIAFKMLVPKFPVTVRLDAVVEAIVDEPLTFKLVKYPVTNDAIFPKMLVTVVEPRVELPTVKKFAATSVPVFVLEPVLIAVAEIFVADRFVDVLFVIVPFVELIFVSTIPPADRFVIVALVIVEFVTFSPVMFATEIFEVEAFVVEARTVVN